MGRRIIEARVTTLTYKQTLATSLEICVVDDETPMH